MENVTNVEPSMAMMGMFMGFFFLAMLAIYVFYAICLQLIAKKTNTPNGWLAWIPIANIYLMCEIAKNPWWWLLLSLVPLVNIVIMIILFMEIAKARGKPGWLGILMIIPLVNFIALGYLAFTK